MFVVYLFDCYCSRSNGNSSIGSMGVQNRVLSTFLNELDGIIGGKSNSIDSSSGAFGECGVPPVLVIVACAKLETMDEALLRPG